MDGGKIDGKALIEAGMCGGDAVGYYPPAGKGVVLVDYEEPTADWPTGRWVLWVLTARTLDKKLDIVMTVDTVEQVRKACDLAGCPLPVMADQATVVSFVPKGDKSQAGGVGMRWHIVEAEAAYLMFRQWADSVPGRRYEVVYDGRSGRFGSVMLTEPGKPTQECRFTSSADLKRIADALVGADGLKRISESLEANVAKFREIGQVVPPNFTATVKVLDVWKGRAPGRWWLIDHHDGFIRLTEPGKPSYSLTFRDADDAARAAVKLLNDDRPKVNAPEPCNGDDTKCAAETWCCVDGDGDEKTCDDLLCGDGDEICSADALADEWLAGGDDAGEVRGVSINRVSTGQSSLTVTSARTDVAEFDMKQVDRSYFAEDALPYLRSAISEMREVYGLGHDMPLVPTADPNAG